MIVNMFYSRDQVWNPSWVSRKYVAFPCVCVYVCVVTFCILPMLEEEKKVDTLPLSEI